MRTVTVVITKPVCEVRDCDQPQQARGLCLRHYVRARKHGTLPPKKKRQRAEVA